MARKLPLSVKQLIEIDGCTRCESCRDNCPVYVTSLLDKSIDFPQSYAGLIKTFKSIVKSQYSLKALFFGPKNPPKETIDQFSKWMYNCLLCGKCMIFCPVLIHTYKLGISIRRWLVEKEYWPETFKLIEETIKETKNVLNLPNEDRGMWADYAYSPVNFYEEGTKAETIYFVGCMISFSPTIQDIAAAFSEVLTIAGENYISLGPNEWCCGYPLYIAGIERGLDELIRHNIEVVKKVGAKKVVFSCPSCYLMWTEFYADKLPNVRFLHASELMLEYIRKGKIKLGKIEMRVTYHDPCDLGRKLRIFDPPRMIIKSIPNIQFKEMPNNRETAWCCGGGGDVEIFDETLPGKLAQLVFRDVEMVEAEALISACGQCKRTFLKAQRLYNKKFRVMDIAELILESTQYT